MNKDQATGSIQGTTDKMPAKAAPSTGSGSQPLKGADKPVEGNIQKKAGDVQPAAKDRGDKL